MQSCQNQKGVADKTCGAKGGFYRDSDTLSRKRSVELVRAKY